MLGNHLIVQWSSTQTVIAISSAEAELNALVKAVSEALSIKHTMKEMGKDLAVAVFTDSNAAKGIVQRLGCGKVKHLETRQLWLQEVVEIRALKVLKMGRELNLADALTHHWSANDGIAHLTAMGIRWRAKAAENQ